MCVLEVSLLLPSSMKTGIEGENLKRIEIFLLVNFLVPRVAGEKKPQRKSE
jgi:hypothetical protein